jgi:hypothetical protein
MEYIKLNRKILEWEWWSDINTSRLFIYMLLKANWKDARFEGKLIPRGSFVSSIPKLSQETALTVREIRTAISHLKSTGEVTCKTYSKYTVFTVKNYCLYQSSDTQNDRQVTGKRHSNDMLTTTIEEKKEIKNIKKEEPRGSKKKFEPPSVDDVGAYCRERGNHVDPQTFVNFYESKGWMVGKNHMKDWKAAVRTWERSGRSDSGGKVNQFNQFQQNDYDMDALERELLSNGG